MTFIETTQEPLRLAYSAPFTDTDGFPASIPTRGGVNQSAPVDDSGDLLYEGLVACGNNFAEILFFGAPSDTDIAAGFRINRIMKIMTPNAKRVQWVPVPVVDGTLEMGGPAGIDETQVESDVNYADSIVITSTYDPGIEIPTDQPDGMIASMRVDLKGCQYLQILFDLSVATNAASANAIVKTY
jgi:hypothetical protein